MEKAVSDERADTIAQTPIATRTLVFHSEELLLSYGRPGRQFNKEYNWPVAILENAGVGFSPSAK